MSKIQLCKILSLTDNKSHLLPHPRPLRGWYTSIPPQAFAECQARARPCTKYIVSQSRHRLHSM